MHRLKLGNTYHLLAVGTLCLLLWSFESVAQSVRPIIDLGDQALATGQYQQAVEQYLEAIAQQEAQDSSSAIMECYYSIGYAYLQMGRMHEFVQYEAKIEPYLDLLDDYTADVMVALGSSHRNLDHLQQAISYYQQAIDRCPEDDPDYYPTLSAAYNNSGIVYRHLGDTERSRLHYQQALHFYQTAPLNYARTLANIGQLYRSEGKLLEAQSSYQQALDTLEAHPNLGIHTRAIIHDDLAMLLDEEGTYQGALAQLDRAKSLLEAGHPFWANIWRHYAQVYRHLGEYGFAERFIEKSQTLREAQYPHRHYSRAALHQDRAQLLADFGEFEKSLSEWQQSMYHLTGDFSPQSLTALPSLQGISYPQEMLESLQQKALAWQGLADKSGTLQYREEANRTYQLATRLTDTLRSSYWGEEAKLLLSSAIVPLYEAAIQNALQLYQGTQSEQWLREAYYFAAKNKAAILREQIREEQAGQIASIPDSLLITQREVRYRLALVEQMLLSHPDSVSFQEKRFRLYERQRVIQRRIEAAYPEYLQLQQEAIFSKASVVQTQLESGSLLLEYFWGKEALHVFALEKNSLSHHQINQPERLRDSLSRYLEMLRDRRAAEQSDAKSLASYQALSFQLYQDLLAPVEANRQYTRLLIIADGPLGYLPFASLCTDSLKTSGFGNLPYLLHRTPIRYLYAVHSLWDTALPEASERFGGFAPSFSGPASSDRSAQPGRLDNQAIVRDMAAQWDGTAYLGNEANRKQFLQSAGEYQVLHLATHAYTDVEEPSRSAFWLNGDSTEAAKVYAYEIYHLPLQARLAVLSACETGTGEWRQGEGIYSLARAFRAAGCATSCMSLWQVNDAATGELMQVFYQVMEEGKRPSEALQQSKLQYLASHDLAHPYYWSAFVVVGQDSSLSPPNAWLRWWWIAGILLLGIGIFGRKLLPLRT